MKYLKEPEYVHGQQARTGILLVNLGTPAAPTAQALRPYLKSFYRTRAWSKSRAWSGG